MSVKRIFTVFSIALLVLASGVLLLANWSALGYRSLSVPTGSMRPHISPGSLVLVHSVPATSLKVGDVITYINPLHSSQTITHRIVKTYMIDGRVPGFVTKGDANKFNDVAVASGSVLGRVVWHIPHLGAWMQWSKSWAGIALLVYIPAILIMLEEVIRLRAYFKTLLPYRLYGVKRGEKAEKPKHAPKYAMAGTLAALSIVGAGAFAPSAFALLSSNTVTLSQNRLSAATKTTPPNGGGSSSTTTNSTSVTCTNNTNIQVVNTSNQTATSGGTNSSGNAAGGTATTDSATNNNSTTVNGTIVNGC